ncbi:5'-3' exonuclease [Buchnera aphidicola]|uniref:5'-3' exonuclease n=1 Tax=Buchnera aphidicola TaxID=9 RepID=UPI0031B869B6
MNNIQIDNNKKILIIDATTYMYRAFYALPSLTNNQGNPSGVIYGVINMLYKLLHKYNTYHIICVFDAPYKNFRHHLFKNYKKNRKSIPENLKKQIPHLQQIITFIGIPIFMIPFVEADDVIGTLSHKIAKQGYSVLISTNDKDMLQLITKKIKIIHTNNNNIIGISEVKKKYGISPIHIIDLLSLMGDSADNIPGVPKIGEKTALILLKHFQSLENIYNNIENIKHIPIHGANKIFNIIKTNKNIAFLSKKLATIKKDVLLNVNIKKNINLPFQKKELIRLFHYYNFDIWKKKIENNAWLPTKT